MYETSDRAKDGYRYIPAVFQYSAGVAALPGFRLERVRFAAPVPMAEGFARIAAYLQGIGRPLTAFCQCELRSPGQFTEEGFRAFNLGYAKVLGDGGLLAEGPIVTKHLHGGLLGARSLWRVVAGARRHACHLLQQLRLVHAHRCAGLAEDLGGQDHSQVLLLGVLHVEPLL